MLDTNNPSIGHFGKSFPVHMIKDFFFVLLAVSILEFALKAAAVYKNYSVNGASERRLSPMTWPKTCDQACATKAGRSLRAPSIRS